MVIIPTETGSQSDFKDRVRCDVTGHYGVPTPSLIPERCAGRREAARLVVAHSAHACVPEFHRVRSEIPLALLDSATQRSAQNAVEAASLEQPSERDEHLSF
jgi:hypothetical protein